MSIRHVDGVPRWFTWLLHHIAVLRCRKVGHRGTGQLGPDEPIYTCTRCGEILREDPWGR